MRATDEISQRRIFSSLKSFRNDARAANVGQCQRPFIFFYGNKSGVLDVWKFGLREQIDLDRLSNFYSFLASNKEEMVFKGNHMDI